MRSVTQKKKTENEITMQRKCAENFHVQAQTCPMMLWCRRTSLYAELDMILSCDCEFVGSVPASPSRTWFKEGYRRGLLLVIKIFHLFFFFFCVQCLFCSSLSSFIIITIIFIYMVNCLKWKDILPFLLHLFYQKWRTYYHVWYFFPRIIPLWNVCRFQLTMETFVIPMMRTSQWLIR